MAKGGRSHSAYQKGIIKRYYENREDLSTQKLGELISELYLCTSEKKAARLWKQVQTALTNAGANQAELEKIVTDRNLEHLAELVNRLF